MEISLPLRRLRRQIRRQRALFVRDGSIASGRGAALKNINDSSWIALGVITTSLWLMLGVSSLPPARSGAETVAASVEDGNARAASEKNDPELPRVLIDTTYISPKGNTITVSSTGNLQESVNRAKCGDVVKLAAGATFVGNFVLPNKGECKDWIVIRSDTPDSNLPKPGVRITPAYSSVLSKVFSDNAGPAIVAAAGANHYRFIGVEIGLTDRVSVNNEIFTIGRSETSASDLPHDITIDRCYIHGTPKVNVKRGVAFNGASLAVVDSYISDIHVEGQDAQTITGWNGPGPFKIVNNELQASGENVMFGGGRPALVGNIPSDIEIRGNHFFKPLSWMVGNPSYAGNHWSVKNLLEFKIAQRVLVTGNILENNWVDGQNGFAFLITPRTEYGTAPWVYVQDITFTYNVLRHTANAVNISGLDDGDPQKLVRGRRVLIQNNLFDDVNGKGRGSGGDLFQLLSGADAVTIDHNTGFQSNRILLEDGIPCTSLVFQNNITPHNTYGVKGSGQASGSPTLDNSFPGFVFRKNVIEGIAGSGLSQSNYPAGNFFPSDWLAVRFVNYANGNYALAPSSPYKNAGTDGKDIGADIGGINRNTAGTDR
jgi:hypothetical protein